MKASSSFTVKMVFIWLFLISIGPGVGSAEGQFSELTVLNPKTYRAPAGRYALIVNPSERNGSGEATYRFEDNGQEQWSATLPFTLWDAGITNNGTVAGYAYTQGQSAFVDAGKFVVVILDRHGKVLQDVKKREISRFIHGPTDPIACGLMVDEPNDRLVVRVSDPDLNRGWQSWWVYRLSTATAVEKLVPVNLMPNAASARSILDAKLVPGTPLTLVHWWRYDGKQVGARFTLIDLQAKPVWDLQLPADDEVPGDDESEDHLRKMIHERGGILRCDEAGRFDLFFAAKSLRVTYSVQQVSGIWKVSKNSESSHDFKSSSRPQPIKMPERPLKYLGGVELQAKTRSLDSPVRKVRKFTFDDKRQIAFLRDDDDGKPPAFVQFDQTGKLLHEIPLTVDVKPDSRWTGCCWVGGSRYVLTNSNLGLEAKSQAWWVDTKTRELTAVVGFDCPAVDRLVGFSDGTFVALATMRFKFSPQQSVIAFNHRGEQIWKRDDDSNNKGNDALFSVKDIARTSRDEIVVLENILHFRRSVFGARDVRCRASGPSQFVLGIVSCRARRVES